MEITASAISLNVNDVAASAAFAKDHFGFKEDMSADGFVSLSRPDAGFNPDCLTEVGERLETS
ncbi:hypothetical protein RRF56_03920 [Nodosilinea sp. E11]|nr:hypothetical protein [Nodosilinea sp. E11]WOD39934.1 hypothetical protein RRF56_03920 [Nodosilinea sp. E11]